jgi:AAA15 family ATPase/GTPase
MLIEFRVKNFRSFRDEAVLSLVASADKTNEEGTVKPTGIVAVPRLLSAAAIYGANAGGKSNLVQAVSAFKNLVGNSATQRPGTLFRIQPFRLDEKSQKTPTEFEITFLLEGVRYQFGFRLLYKRILDEWLIVYRSSQPATWYERTFDPRAKKSLYKFSTQLLGPKATWSDATREDALFLSTAVQLNSEQLRPIFDFLTLKLVTIENGGVFPTSYTIAKVLETDSVAVRDLLAAADISISDIRLEKHEARGQLAFDFDKDGNLVAVDNADEVRTAYVPLFEHRTERGSATFHLGDESEGTQKLFALAGPLFSILEAGDILVVDELDRSLHALLVRQIVEMFQNPELNPNGAQIIFTTHDTSLLDGDLLRRDQIWFADKDEHQVSHLNPLSDFSPRKGEALERNYLAGRYGGVPILRTPELPAARTK